jgi:hypothetical protein
MEHDRDLQRLKATVQWYSAKRLAIYAAAEDVPVAVAAAQLVRLGLDEIAEREASRATMCRRCFNDLWNINIDHPKPGESKRVTVALENDEIERVKEFAASEFEDVSTGLNILIMYAFNSPHCPSRYRAKWHEFCKDYSARKRAA